ncbi:hypothetical protein JTB14_012819 [Gonioctena quinquepunctata]|nr:hypothetical protein JTB14_012819 [Gonioctena quinquepunctata]
MEQKQLSELLIYELELLSKLTDMNSELENLLEQAPIDITHSTRNKCEPNDTEASSSVQNRRCNVIPDSLQPEPNSNIRHSVHVDPPVKQIETGISNKDTAEAEVKPPTIQQNCSLTEGDIQKIRDTLRSFSFKLGLNEDNSMEMEEGNEKPSIDYKRSPCSIPPECIIVPDIISNSDSDGFEVPVRDISLSADYSEIKNNCSIDNHGKPEIIQKDYSKPDSASESETTNVPQCLPQNDSSPSNECSEGECGISDSSSSVANNEFQNCQTFKQENISDLSSSHFESCNNSPHSTNTATGLSSEESNKWTKSEQLNNHEFIERKPISLHNSVSSDEMENLTRSRRKRKNKILKLQPKRSPKAGDTCIFSYILSPSEFYIHVLDEETVSIDCLSKKIFQNYNSSIPTHSSKKLACNDIGQYCLAFIPKCSSWFRAEVLDWYSDNESDVVLIQLVDYGNKENISYKNLRSMIKELTNIPKLAVRCHFPLMYPPNSTRLNKTSDWPEVTVKALMAVAGGSDENDDEKQNVPFKIVYANQELNSLAVDLYNPLEENEELTIGQILIDLGLAKQIVEECDESNMDLERFLEDIDELETADNINEAITGYDARDEARICRFTKADGTCYKGKNCKLEHSRLSKDGFTEDTEFIFKEAMYDLPLPMCGESVTVLVTCFIDMCRFFVQIVRKPHQGPKYIMDKDFFSLMTDINSPKQVQTYESFKIQPAFGEIVLVKHWTKKWLRAVVRTHSEDIQVFTVDVGETMKVTMNDLRKIKPHLLKTPFQAVECYIHDYKMRAEVLSSFLPLKIRLRTMNGLTDIGKKLEEHDFAQACVQDCNPIDDCCLKTITNCFVPMDETPHLGQSVKQIKYLKYLSNAINGGGDGVKYSKMASIGFRWLDILEKEFDKAFVDIDLSVGELESEEPNVVFNVRQKLCTLSSCFAQLTHKAQTIFQNSAKLEVSIFCNEILQKMSEDTHTKYRGNRLLRMQLNNMI